MRWMTAFAILVLATSGAQAFAQDGSARMEEKSMSGTADSNGTPGSVVPQSVEPASTTAASATVMPGMQEQSKATTSAPAPQSEDPSVLVPIDAPIPEPASPPPTVFAPAMSEVGESAPIHEPGMLLVIIASILGAGGIVAGTYAMVQSRKKKSSDDAKNRCFDIKRLMEEKLRELTDLKGQLQSGIEGRVRDAVRAVAVGTVAGDALALVERVEREYEQLTKLYEQCVADLPSKPHVVIVHGCPSSQESLMDVSERTHDKHWIPWLREQLQGKGISAEVPLMPEPWEPDYEKFKKEFEKYNVDENTMLVGHSCGCAFLVRWLGEKKKKIRKLILVAPWKIAEKNPAKERFYDFPIDKTIPSRVGEIVMFGSDNDSAGGPESITIYHGALGGRLVALPGRGHFTPEDMGTVEFPELFKEIA